MYMDSQETKTENFELPTPGSGAPESGQHAPEQGPAPELQTTPTASDPGGATYSMPGAVPPADPATVMGATAPLATSSASSTHGLAAEDADLIEKTWVEKAKQIVLETRGDPYNQNKEINKVKADYIKKRYNKDIKLGSE